MFITFPVAMNMNPTNAAQGWRVYSSHSLLVQFVTKGKSLWQVVLWWGYVTSVWSHLNGPESRQEGGPANKSQGFLPVTHFLYLEPTSQRFCLQTSNTAGNQMSWKRHFTLKPWHQHTNCIMFIYIMYFRFLGYYPEMKFKPCEPGRWLSRESTHWESLKTGIQILRLNIKNEVGMIPTCYPSICEAETGDPQAGFNWENIK